jgi:plastocyanin
MRRNITLALVTLAFVFAAGAVWESASGAPEDPPAKRSLSGLLDYDRGECWDPSKEIWNPEHPDAKWLRENSNKVGVIVDDNYVKKLGVPAVIYLESIDAPVTFETSRLPQTMGQKGSVFNPKYLPVMAGGTVVFDNDDGIVHNVKSTTEGSTFNLGNFEPGKQGKRVFAESGYAEILCDIHGTMQAFVIVTPTPIWAVTSTSGRTKGQALLRHVPAGTWQVSIWHEKLKKATQTVTVTADGKPAVVKFEKLQKKN